MSAPIDNGGPAFPVTGKQLPLLGNELVAQFVHFPHGGMTLRDWFACQAMAAMIPLKPRLCEKFPEATADDIEELVSIAAYLQARAMIAARQQP